MTVAVTVETVVHLLVESSTARLPFVPIVTIAEENVQSLLCAIQNLRVLIFAICFHHKA